MHTPRTPALLRSVLSFGLQWWSILNAGGFIRKVNSVHVCIHFIRPLHSFGECETRILRIIGFDTVHETASTSLNTKIGYTCSFMRMLFGSAMTHAPVGPWSKIILDILFVLPKDVRSYPNTIVHTVRIYVRVLSSTTIKVHYSTECLVFRWHRVVKCPWNRHTLTLHNKHISSVAMYRRLLPISERLLCVNCTFCVYLNGHVSRFLCLIFVTSSRL